MLVGYGCRTTNGEAAMDQYSSDDYEHRVRERAYALWEAAGRPADQDQHFWFEAQREFEQQHPENAFPHAGDPHPTEHHNSFGSFVNS